MRQTPSVNAQEEQQQQQQQPAPSMAAGIRTHNGVFGDQSETDRGYKLRKTGDEREATPTAAPGASSDTPTSGSKRNGGAAILFFPAFRMLESCQEGEASFPTYGRVVSARGWGVGERWRVKHRSRRDEATACPARKINKTTMYEVHSWS